MNSQKAQGRDGTLKKFYTASPEFKDPTTREHRLFLETYKKQFEKAVEAGSITYQEALESAREIVVRRIGVEDIKKTRTRQKMH